MKPSARARSDVQPDRERRAPSGPTLRAAVLALSLAPIVAPSGLRADQDPVQEQLRARLEQAGVPARIQVAGAPIHAGIALPSFYERRAYRPAWVGAPGVSPAADSLLAALADARHEGLRPTDYHLDELRALREAVGSRRVGPPRAGGRSAPDPGALVDLELLLTDAFLVYADHLADGRVDPVTLHADWVPTRSDVDLSAMLERAVDAGAVRAVLEEMRPPQEGYRRLLDAYGRYRRLADEAGWPRIPDGPRLAVGDTGQRVLALRRRLQAGDGAGGGHRATPGPEAAFDSALHRAVRAFQRRHGLQDDGVVGPATLAALNVPARERTEQLRVNLERWRWLPRSLGRRHVRVNAADFDLDVVEEDRVVLSMRAIVGRSYRRTPALTDRITYLVFSPYWHVPHNLAAQDQLPMQQKDPGYFRRVGMRAFSGWGADAREIDPDSVSWQALSARNFPFRLRQDPGPYNALGGVKFMFPNRFSVYLHDTPARDLFARTARAFSSGCIRVEKAAELAAYLLQGDPRWTAETIRQAMGAGSEQTVRLPEPVPVHLLYWTAWSDGETVQFRTDVYDRDGPVLRALHEAPPAPPAVPGLPVTGSDR